MHSLTKTVSFGIRILITSLYYCDYLEKSLNLIFLVEQTEKIEHHDDEQITNWFIIKRCYPEIYSIFGTLLGMYLKAITVSL